MAARQRRCRIAEEWQSFREAALGGGVPPIQLQEMRRAFFAGALACKHVILRDISDSAETTDADLSILEDLEAEFQAFGESVKAGRA
jgi:predicted metal-dependent HD superfamily phosphohydrolase